MTSPQRRTAGLVVLAAAGVALATAIASSGHIGSRDASILLAWAVGGATASAVVAIVALWIVRHSRVTVQATVAALAPVLAVAVGLVGAARAMFIAAHDVWILSVVLAGAGTVAVVTALIVGSRVARASATLSVVARRIGDGDNATDEVTRSSRPRRSGTPGELADLAGQLEDALARLAASREQAAALEESRRELVAWVSHDLRTPLAGIRAMVEALEDGVVVDPETVARYHRTMRIEADRLAGLVDDLFELSRIHAGALNLCLEYVALDDLVSDAVAGAAMAADAKGVELRGSMCTPAPIVELSTPEIGRAVRNLVDNAIRYTPKGGFVSVEAAIDIDKSTALVSVRDACGGIPDHDIARVFELAYRGDSARSPGDGGAGVGLAVARGLVEAHRGQISVENEGDGCRFTIRLPLAGSAAPPLDASQAS